MSLAPTFTTHPRALQRIRDASLPVAGLLSFMCKKGSHVSYKFEGRKNASGGGWVCAECAKGNAS